MQVAEAPTGSKAYIRSLSFTIITGSTNGTPNYQHGYHTEREQYEQHAQHEHREQREKHEQTGRRKHKNTHTKQYKQATQHNSSSNKQQPGVGEARTVAKELAKKSRCWP